MRFSSAILIAVVSALASSVSARPTDDGTRLARNAQCSTLCVRDSQCVGCKQGYCVNPIFCQV
ncbi:hypothetical protein CY34DRAFT_811867, partial [Suillus luteus UH-Slu-Lm8-n1]